MITTWSPGSAGGPAAHSVLGEARVALRGHRRPDRGHPGLRAELPAQVRGRDHPEGAIEAGREADVELQLLDQVRLGNLEHDPVLLGHEPRGRRAGVEQGDQADDVAGSEVILVVSDLGPADAALEDHEHARALVTAARDLLARAHRSPRAMLRQPLDVRLGQGREDVEQREHAGIKPARAARR